MNGVVLAARDLHVCHGPPGSGFDLRVESLDLAAGEVLAILGPNGAGKSTLLRSLAGLERLTGGDVERHTRGPVTMVFQRPIVFAGSVEHNVRSALRAVRLPRAEASLRIREALQRFGIHQLAARNAATLSGGETRRLALARAFSLRPAALLLDEPFEDLDGSGQESLSLDLRRAIGETRVAVAVVTHDLRRALLLADRIAILQRGRLAQCAARDTVLNQPMTTSIARIVGMSNVVRGLVCGPAAGVPAWVEVDSVHRIPLARAPAPGRSVWVGIRPEHLKVDVGRGEGIAIGEGVVRHVVSDGVAVTVTLAWAGGELRTHLIAGRGLARTIAAGDELTLSVRPEEVHWMPDGEAEVGRSAALGGA